MKKYILLLFTITSLIANESIEITIECLELTNKEAKITIESNKLNPSEDAIMDNLGGYVDIPQERFYIRSNNQLFPLKGRVETNYKRGINIFTSYLKITSINELKKENQLKFIQKIDLLENNKEERSQDVTTKNILKVHFAENLEGVSCKK